MPIRSSAVSCKNSATLNKISCDMNCDPSVSIGDLVYQSETEDNFAISAIDSSPPVPVIGIVCAKPTANTCTVQFGGTLFTPGIDRGTVFVGDSGELNPGTPTTGFLQRIGYSLGNGKIVLGIELRRIRCPV